MPCELAVVARTPSRQGGGSVGVAGAAGGRGAALREDVVDELLVDDAVRPRGREPRRAVESRVDGVQLRRQVAANVEPPVAYENRL